MTIGQIVGVFGIKGVVKVAPLTDFPSRFAVGRTVWTEVGAKEITSLHWHKAQVRLGLQGIVTIEQAEPLVGTYLTAPAIDPSILEQGEFAVSQLIGCTVIERGKDIGTVEDVVKSPAHDLLVVGGVMVPFIGQFVKTVDTDKKIIEVALIEGLRPGESAE